MEQFQQIRILFYPNKITFMSSSELIFSLTQRALLLNSKSNSLTKLLTSLFYVKGALMIEKHYDKSSYMTLMWRINTNSLLPLAERIPFIFTQTATKSDESS